jgi:hypothetical protein
VHSQCAENRDFNGNESTVIAPEENNLSGEHECMLACARERSDLIRDWPQRPAADGVTLEEDYSVSQFCLLYRAVRPEDPYLFS